MGTGKFGTYIKHDGKFYPAASKKPSEIDLATAVGIIEAKRAAKPSQIGEIYGKRIELGSGKFGAYLKYEDKFFSITPEQASDLSVEKAMELINAAKTKEKEKEQNLLKTVGKYQIRKGQYGLYVNDGEIKAGLKKTITEEEALKLSEKEIKELSKTIKNGRKKAVSKAISPTFLLSVVVNPVPFNTA